MDPHTTAQANATHISNELARTERLRRRAATEVKQLRGRTRDTLARVVELEALASGPERTTPFFHARSSRRRRVWERRDRVVSSFSSHSRIESRETLPFFFSSPGAHAARIGRREARR